MTDDPNVRPPETTAGDPVADTPTAPPAETPQFDTPRVADVIESAPVDPTADAVKNADGSPVLDFTDYESAAAQAEALGGSVEHVGVAFHVNAD